MKLRSLRTSNLREVNARAGIFVAACGYEHRSVAISKMVSGPELKIAMCFEESPDALSRGRNEAEFAKRGFLKYTVSGNDSRKVQEVVEGVVSKAARLSKSVAFDISSMTRAWHGGIVRQLRTMEIESELETFFAYVPARFKGPPARVVPNEFVEPVNGFASLTAPDLPISLVIGMGYERERALGLQQMLDPKLTMLMIPKSGDNDPYYTELVRNNKIILDQTDPRRVFEYNFSEPAAAFATLASVVTGLRESSRVVLASLGPKIYGLMCFLLASRFSDVSVWRVSPGAHASPRDVQADINRIVVLSAIWEPSNRSGAGLK
jgi:hypothetical protein